MKKIGYKIGCMIAVLALIFGFNALVSMKNLRQIEMSGQVISENYMQMQKEFADLGMCFERSQKYANIIVLVDYDRFGEIAKGIIPQLQSDLAFAQQKIETIQQIAEYIGNSDVLAAWGEYHSYVEEMYQSMLKMQDMVIAGRQEDAITTLGHLLTIFDSKWQNFCVAKKLMPMLV